MTTIPVGRQSDRTIAEIVADIIACADEADGNQVDVATYCHELIRTVSGQTVWRPMEFAPKDGTSLLFTLNDYNIPSVDFGWWSTVGQGWRNYENDVLTPVAWRPMPTPLAAEAVGEDDIASARLIAAAPDLLTALKAVVETGDDCPMCDRGRLRNPEKTHWPECPFGRAQAVIAKFAPPAVEAKEPQ